MIRIFIKSLLFSGLIILALVGKSQSLDIIDLSTNEKLNEKGEYSLSGKVKNNSSDLFNGEVILEVSLDRSGGESNPGIDKGDFEYNLGSMTLKENEFKEFSIVRNAAIDNFRPGKNIICVWPRYITNKKDLQRNIICVWPRVYPDPKDNSPKGSSKRMAEKEKKTSKDFSEQNDLSFNVFPNPLVNITYLLINSLDERIVHVNVMNNFGQLIKTVDATVPKGQTFVEVDLNDVGNGVYFFEVTDNGKNHSIKTGVKNE
ncbi:MAG: hypothetical protein A3H98_14775 [Bacteroidetes bacterium RIFCSPLOWO2_02_FULL_36_8]|nr:MAG: hypothetical protein A3H98_14775 [Bacteroidetes bacterium RIFCSPLOWO2_02_FULL_36_8]OFY70096.1 MAG: hypothetical protein A3G23_11695 [Bacteroidetes bacterium RIFCSPLOWO2_12_FULL_37_12]